MKNLIYLLAFVVTTLAIACTNPQSGEANQAEATEQNAPAQEPAREQVAPNDRISNQLTQSGIKLDSAQVEILNGVAAKYDFNAATDRNARREMIRQYQAEVMSSVLNEEQRAAFSAYQESRKAQREERQKQQQQ